MEILDKRGSQGVLLGVDSDFIKKVFGADTRGECEATNGNYKQVIMTGDK